MSYLPRLWLFSADKEPLVTGSPDAETIMTDSIDTWELLYATITNSSDSDKMYVIRTVAKNASGSVYFDLAIVVDGFATPTNSAPDPSGFGLSVGADGFSMSVDADGFGLLIDAESWNVQVTG